MSDSSQPPRNIFTAERRRALLDECFSLQRKLDELGSLIERASGTETPDLIKEEKNILQRWSGLKNEYVAGVPVTSLSCCPFTGQVMQHSIDHFGLDGLWWNFGAACRPVEQLPETYFAFAGALRLTGSPPWFPFVCKPGPELPYVLPRMLRHPAIKAVISTGSIGEHQGFAITYFAKPVPYEIPRVNTWGANEYKCLDDGGNLRWGSRPDNLSDKDFDLAPWIANGKLLWIPPGDTTLTLRDTVSGCPYIGLDGRRAITYIQNGKVWW